MKKITPTFDLTWWIKWVSTVVIIIGMVWRASGGLPLVDFILTFIGSVGWAIVGFMWHDRSLLLLNGVILAIMAIGILRVL